MSIGCSSVLRTVRPLVLSITLTALLPFALTRATAAPAPRPLDPVRDTRLEHRIMLRCEGTPISGVLRRIQEQTGVLMRSEGRAGDERLVAFVPSSPLHEVMASVADLHRLRWRRGETGGMPSYTLYKDRADAQVEEKLRQKGFGQAWEEIKAQLEEKRAARASNSPRYAAANAVQKFCLEMIPGLWDRLHQEGFLSIPVRTLPKEQRARLDERLRPYLVNNRQEQIDSNARIAELLQKQGRDVPKRLTEEPGPPSEPDDCTFILTLNLANGVQVYAGLRDGRGGTSTFFDGKSTAFQTLGLDLYQDRDLRPQIEQAPVRPDPLPDRFTRPFQAVAGDSRFDRLWAEKLARFSDSTGIPIYSDLYPRSDRVAGVRSTRNESPLPQGADAQAVLNQLCGDHLAETRDADPGTTSVWWHRGETALIRSRNWLWATQSVLPADLVSRLETQMRGKQPLSPADVPVLASLSLPQVQGMWGFIGNIDAWHYLVKVPSRLSVRARQLLVTEGITWDTLPDADRELLLRQLPPLPGLRPDYAAQHRLGGMLGQNGAQAYVSLSGAWGGMKHAGSLDVQVPDRVNRPGLLVLADLRRPVAREKVPRLVCSLYYPWYAVPAVSGSYRHVNGVDATAQKIANFAHYPASGPYDSSDEATLKRHVAQAKAAGIDVLVCSWWGPESFEDAALRKLLPLAREAGLKVCVYLEPFQKESSPEAIAQSMSGWLKTLGSDPAYLRVEGRPVVFLFAGKRQQADLQVWTQALAALDRSVPPGVLAITPRQSPLDTLVFDGIQNADAFYLGRPATRAAATGSLGDAKSKGRIAVAAVGPGFDIRHHPGKGFQVDREEGKRYRECWEGALKAAPDWVLVESFNQWEIGTEIEPSVQFGDLYLKLTAEYAARFKAGQLTPGP